jgi:hypothetical protein
MTVQKFDIESLPLSASVRGAVRRFSPQERIISWALVSNILSAHPEYANFLGGKLHGAEGPAQGELRTVDEWLGALTKSFDMERVQQKVQFMDGRLTIWGLAQLDPSLGSYLDSFEFLKALEEEYRNEKGISPNELLRHSVEQNLPTSNIPPHDNEAQQQVIAPEGSQVASDSTDSERSATQVYSPPVAGYISDRVDQESRDLLDIKREVANIANVLTFKQVQPPLALGLFGDWGSGKTFFMGKLQRYVSQIADHYQKKEQETGEEAMWCSRVAQIEFNAWHFSDTNLWANLVTRIYEGLYSELHKGIETADAQKKKEIAAQIKEVKQKSVKAEAQLNLAKTQVHSAEENLKNRTKEREERENSLLGMISNIPSLLEGTELDKPLQEAANTLGVPQAAQTYEALEELNGQLKNLSGRFTAVTANLLNSPWTLIFMALFVVILVAITFLIEHWALLSEIEKRVAEISTFLLFIIGWLQVQVKRGLELVKTVDSALAQARKNRQTKIDTDEQVIEAQKALTEAQTEEEAASANLEAAKSELQHLEQVLQELRPERKFQRFIETQASTGAYAKYLGIISLIRADFENMSRILAEIADERRNFKETPPIQRIILYIDDLDRCGPEKVVEVLEAIHLLLFFKLFVVVVAVDPRWLRHSLAQHFPATLNESGGKGLFDDRDEMSASFTYSTPQDYLEKIFQIPFALRPVEKGGYQSLVDDLLKPLPARERRNELGSSSVSAVAESDGKRATGIGADQQSQTENQTNIGTELPALELSNQQDQQVVQEEVHKDKHFTPIPPRQLEFSEWEKEDIERLWLMFRTPRTVKRFINIYRLLRAGLISQTDVDRFQGTKTEPGEYRVALLLLAAITAFPNEAGQLLYRIDAWLDIQDLKDKEGSCNWVEVLEYLKKEPGFQQVNTNGERNDQDHSKVANRERANTDEAVVNSWKLLLHCLEQVIQDSAWHKSFKLDRLRFWVMRVARFSFSVQPT